LCLLLLLLLVLVLSRTSCKHLARSMQVFETVRQRAKGQARHSRWMLLAPCAFEGPGHHVSWDTFLALC
jgi:hypothetical protein